MKNYNEEGEPVYTNKKGLILPLSEIVRDKRIISVEVNYLSKEKTKEARGLKGLLGIKKTYQVNKKLTIHDKKRITLYYSLDNDSLVIRFYNEKEIKKLGEDYEENTLFVTLLQPTLPGSAICSISTHVGNLRGVDWE